jgi:hypothetical protein
MNATSPFFQFRRKIEEAEGLRPEIISREIIDPGVDEDECRSHGHALFVSYPA